MGLGILQAERVQGLVLKFDAGLVVLMISTVIDIVPVDLEKMLPLPPFAVPQPEFFAGVIQAGELGDFLTLTSAALLQSSELMSLSQ